MSRLGDFINGLVGEMLACPGCGCGGAQQREDCGCMRHDCECSGYGGFQGPDTDYDDTYDYQHPTGPSDPVRGKWWLRGKCSTACADVNCPPNGACQREELYRADQLAPASFPWLNGPPPKDPDMAVPTDAQVEHLHQAVDRAFTERDRLWDVYRETGRAEDEKAMERPDEHAARLLDQYNTAVTAQWAEVERRRAENLARYEQEQIDRDMGKDGGGTFVDMPPPAQPYQPLTEEGRNVSRWKRPQRIDGADYYTVPEDESSGWTWIPQLDGGTYNPKPDATSDRLDMPPPAQPYQLGNNRDTTATAEPAATTDDAPRYGDPAWEEARRQAENADRYRRSAADADEQADRAEHMADPTNEIGQDAREWNRRRAETQRADAEELRDKAAEAERKAAGYQPENRANNGHQPRPQQQRQTTSQTATSGGTGMSQAGNIEAVKAEIMAAAQTAQEASAAFQQAGQATEQAAQQLQQVTAGTSQADASEAVAMLQQAQQMVTEAQQMVMQATQAAEQVAARL